MIRMETPSFGSLVRWALLFCTVHCSAPSVVVGWVMSPTRHRHRHGSSRSSSVVAPIQLQPAASAAAATTTTSLYGVASGVRRVRDSLLGRERSTEDLKIGIAGFYDRSSKLWEDVWGEHMHHGYYVPEDRTDHVQAQIDLIDEVLRWGNVTDDAPPIAVVDVGCGIGGSSRHIVGRFPNCTAQGITLSPYQAARGNELAAERGLTDRATFRVADALEMPFEDDSFDLVWSLESGEHMPDKARFVEELFRVATPGGRILIVTWCHRDLTQDEPNLTHEEERLLAKINRAYYLPRWCSVQDYVNLLEANGATDVRREDWSYIIAPFWKAVIRSSMNFRSVWGLMRSGFSTIRGAYAMLLMLRGFNRGLIKFGLLTCTKPKI
jgi:tocopherol O-methyltransferase